MKREEKNAQSRQKILEGALPEFASKGYEGASLNTVCAQIGLSKGLIYHYFKDKDALYLACIAVCFHAMTDYIRDAAYMCTGTAAERLNTYFDARLRFFAEHPHFLGLFSDALLNPPAHLIADIKQEKADFDAMNIAVLTAILSAEPLREGISVSAVAEDFRMYVDFFNTQFRAALRGGQPAELVLREHEKTCRRQLDILLHGVLRNL